jgi:hypothetical protein
MSDITNLTEANIQSAMDSIFGSASTWHFVNLYSVGQKETASEDWSAAGKEFGSIWSNMATSWNYQSGSDLNSYISQFFSGFATDNGALKILGNTVSTIGLSLGEAVGSISAGISEGLSAASEIDKQFGSIEAWVDSQGYNFLNGGASTLSNVITTLADNIGNDSVIMSVISKGLTIFSDSISNGYTNGVDETSFGGLLENSWNKGSSSFLATFKNGSSKYKLNVLSTTPLDPGENSENLYGTMMLGAPPVFNHISDPKNRAVSSTFLRDAKFLSLTPGYPQYNGSYYLQKKNNDQLHMTSSGEAMLEYLLSNGVDANFAKKDRRYYTFKASYSDYYAYLEAMLNPLWIKMGLASTANNEFNIFSFFKITDPSTGKIITDSAELIDRYRSSLGFYVNPTGALTESINSTSTSYGNENASTVNTASEEYQRINYLTGMGTGGNVRNAVRQATASLGVGRNIASFVSDSLSGTWAGIKSIKSDGLILGALQTATGLVSDTQKFLTEKDNGAVMQSFATTNGMKVVYPELWSDSTYMKSVNINFEFISPYGDPLSVFQYVMVPFCALLCFAMPRQAADNGYVSPFFVRADIPGYFTSDLAMITKILPTMTGVAWLYVPDM